MMIQCLYQTFMDFSFNFRTNHNYPWWAGTTYKIWIPDKPDMPSEILSGEAEICNMVSKRKGN